ncbi:MAG: peptidylprolyl isomerase [Proteobacteria bacterium]|nr:peptidylprolyl isomerase [Pseudomonadota bacterium]NIS62917.1 peptidylprolyl isomerase [Pseudomonadota bacterium]
MAKAKNGDVVKVHYTGKLEDGRVFSSSENGDPLQFTIGDGNTIPGFEEAVVGMSPGESKTEKVSADQAFGPYREELVVEIDRGRIPEGVDPKVGKRLQVQKTDGGVTEVLVTGVTESKVTLDANHPLARNDLVFDIHLLEIL